MAAAESIRAFIAIPIPEAIVSALAKVQSELGRELREVSWTRPEGIHLTLQFLGNIEVARLDLLCQALADSVAVRTAFTLEIAGTGSFGNRVIWAGVRGELDALARLADSVRSAPAQFGTNREERAFKAHVTLGRLRTPRRGLPMKLRRVEERCYGSWRVEEVHLYHSRLSPHGAQHIVLATVPLRSVER